MVDSVSSKNPVDHNPGMVIAVHEFFAGVEYIGQPFKLFGTAHVVTLGIILLANLAVVVFRQPRFLAARPWFQSGLAVVLLVNETLYHVWRIVTHTWTLQEMLPFHMCTIMVYLSALMLLTKHRALYHYLYFLGIGAAFQALLTPNAEQWGFPHFRFFQTMISHGAIVMTAVYLTVVEGCRPYFKDIGRILIGGNIYMAMVQVVNVEVGSNYLWVARKPDIASVLDYMGPWPWYILGMEALGIVSFLILYLPFVILDWRNRKAQRLFS